MHGGKQNVVSDLSVLTVWGAADANRGQPPVTRVIIDARKGHKGSGTPTIPGDESLLLKKSLPDPSLPGMASPCSRPP